MSIESAKFIVQRGATQFSCRGDELNGKLQTGDLLAVQHENDNEASKYSWIGTDGILDSDWLCCTDINGVTYKVRGSLFKTLFGVPWLRYDYWYHVKDLSGTLKYNNAVAVFNAQTEESYQNAQAELIADGTEYIVCGNNSTVEPVNFKNYSINRTKKFDFGDLTDVSRCEYFTDLLYDCREFEGSVDYFDTSSAKSFHRMFYSCYKFNAPVNHFDVSTASSFASMFQGCSVFDQPLTSWMTSNANTFNRMFMSCKVFNQPVNHFDVSKVIDTASMFEGAAKFDQPLINFVTSKNTALVSMFTGATVFNQPLDSWDVSGATDLRYMFKNAKAFQQDISMWDVSRVTKFNNMFEAANSFDQDLSSWNVSKAIEFVEMFWKNTKFNNGGQPLIWETPAAKKASAMFKQASKFNVYVRLNNNQIEDWNNFFASASQFNQEIGDWDMSSATILNSMFNSCYNFQGDISAWNVAKVYNMDYMFDNYNKALDLSQWCVSAFIYPPFNFLPDTNTAFVQPVWGTCPRGEDQTP